MDEIQNQQPQKNCLHPKIWVPVLVLTLAAAGYLIWASQTSSWPFEANKEPLQTIPNALDYTAKYGFELTFPSSWKGYSVMEQKWQGFLIDNSEQKYSGPQIVFRNPQWTKEKPWQDIPIMIFTPDEWNLIELEQLAVSAAPIGPSKLGESEKYVFALPPRWVGFTDALGQTEAQDIVKTFKVTK